MNAALIVFRETDAADYDPDFTVPLYPITPIVGMVLSLGLLAFVGTRELALSAVFVVGSVVWYFAYARRYTVSEGLLSGYVRSRSEEMPTPVVDAAETVAPNGTGETEAGPTVMVAVSNPRTEGALATLAGALASAKNGRVLATHVVQVPDQTSLAAAADRRDRIAAESKGLLQSARADIESFDVPVETRTVLSHQGVAEVFDAAREHGVDTLIMGYGGARLAGGRAEGALASNPPCDVLVLNEREFDPSRVLVPTAGGYSSDLSAEVAHALRDNFDADVAVLYVTDGDRDTGREFLSEWAAEHGLADADLLVETGDVEEEIARAATDRTLVIVGATEEGLLSRVVRGSLTLSVLEDLETSVLLTERPRTRSLRDRLFGR
jgi:nucleotide-binding universal stress UspA family protein